MAAFVAFDLFILIEKRPKKIMMLVLLKSHSAICPDQSWGKNQLQRNIIAGLPGSEESFTIQQFQKALDAYSNIDKVILKNHLIYFLQQIIPVAESRSLARCGDWRKSGLLSWLYCAACFNNNYKIFLECKCFMTTWKFREFLYCLFQVH